MVGLRKNSCTFVVKCHLVATFTLKNDLFLVLGSPATLVYQLSANQGLWKFCWYCRDIRVYVAICDQKDSVKEIGDIENRSLFPLSPRRTPGA